MTRTIDYFVLSTNPAFGMGATGTWTQHYTLKDAKDCAYSIKVGRIWRRTTTEKPDGTRSETMRRIFT